MLSYCLKFRKNIESKNPRMVKTNKAKLIFLWKCAVCDSEKKLAFIKKEEPRGLLSNLRLKTPLSKISLLGTIN